MTQDLKRVIRDNLAKHYEVDPDTIRLAQIIDCINAAEERGLPNVSLDIDDARWLVEVAGGDVQPIAA